MSLELGPPNPTHVNSADMTPGEIGIIDYPDGVLLGPTERIWDGLLVMKTCGETLVVLSDGRSPCSSGHVFLTNFRILLLKDGAALTYHSPRA